MGLREQVERTQQTKEIRDFEETFIACLKDRSSNALDSVFELAKIDLYVHEGAWHKRSTKEVAAVTALCWRQEGVSKIVEYLRSNSLGQMATETSLKRALAHAASDSLVDFSMGFKNDYPRLNNFLDYEYFGTEECIMLANETLMDLVLNDDPEVPIPFSYLSDLSIYSMDFYKKLKAGEFDPKRPSAFSSLFSCVQARWFQFNDDRLRRLHDLLSSDDEELAHTFLKLNPQILEPFYARIWSKPRLGENLVADFVIKQMDGSFIVVEIEKPSDKIIGRGGDLSAKTTNAIRQALEYRDWLVSNHLYATRTFEGLTRPTALVVIGNESTLTESQAARLRQENESRQGVVRIAGFDWLYERARNVRHNLVVRSAMSGATG